MVIAVLLQEAVVGSQGGRGQTSQRKWEVVQWREPAEGCGPGAECWVRWVRAALFPPRGRLEVIQTNILNEPTFQRTILLFSIKTPLFKQLNLDSTFCLSN